MAGQVRAAPGFGGDSLRPSNLGRTGGIRWPPGASPASPWAQPPPQAGRPRKASAGCAVGFGQVVRQQATPHFGRSLRRGTLGKCRSAMCVSPGRCPFALALQCGNPHLHQSAVPDVQGVAVGARHLCLPQQDVRRLGGSHRRPGQREPGCSALPFPSSMVDSSASNTPPSDTRITVLSVSGHPIPPGGGHHILPTPQPDPSSVSARVRHEPGEPFGPIRASGPGGQRIPPRECAGRRWGNMMAVYTGAPATTVSTRRTVGWAAPKSPARSTARIFMWARPQMSQPW